MVTIIGLLGKKIAEVGFRHLPTSTILGTWCSGAVREPDYVQGGAPPRRFAAFGTVTGLDTYPARWFVDIDTYHAARIVALDHHAAASRRKGCVIKEVDISYEANTLRFIIVTTLTTHMI